MQSKVTGLQLERCQGAGANVGIASETGRKIKSD